MYIYGVCMLLILENNTFVGLDCTRFPYMCCVSRIHCNMLEAVTQALLRKKSRYFLRIQKCNVVTVRLFLLLLIILNSQGV